MFTICAPIGSIAERDQSVQMKRITWGGVRSNDTSSTSPTAIETACC